MATKGFFQFEIIIIVLSDLFEYLCYGAAAIINIYYSHSAGINFSPSTTSNHLHPLQVENCDSNLRLVVDEDDNGKFRLQRVKGEMNIISAKNWPF